MKIPERNPVKPEVKVEQIKAKDETKKVEVQALIQEGRASIVGNTSYSSGAMKYKLDYLLQANVKQQVVNPYENKTSSQIATERIKNYENSSNKQSSAEETGKLIADIAKYDPAKANEVADLFLNDKKLENGHKDELAQETVRSLDDNQLAIIAKSDDGKKLLNTIHQNLVGSSPVHGDEAIDANRIVKALQTGGIFEGTTEGTYPTTNGVNPSNNPKATPQEVADYIKYNTDETARYAFIEALSLHSKDANSEWISQFFSALGADKTAEMISKTVDASSDNSTFVMGGTDPESRILQAELVTNTLEKLHKDGKLSQESINAIVNSMNYANPYVATEIFGKSSDNALKEMFVKAAVANGKEGFDASAMHVLNTLPSSSQEKILNGLSQSQLNSFIEGAMSEQKKIPSFSDSVKFGINAGSESVKDLLNLQEFGGVEKLLSKTTERAIQYPPYSQKSPFSESLNLKIFNAAITGLNNDKAFKNLKDNVEFKNNLAGLFIEKKDQIISSMMKDGDLPIESVVSLSKFVELSLFTPPLGNESTSALNRLPDELSGLIGGLIKDARDNGNSNSARLAGRLLGAVDNAAERARDRVANDKAARDKFIDTVVGLAFDLIPFPGIGKLGEGGSALLKRALGGLEGVLKKETLDRIENMTAAEAKKFLAEELKSNDQLKSELQQSTFSDLLFESINQVGAGIDENVAANLRTILESAYNFVDSGNEGKNPKFE